MPRTTYSTGIDRVDPVFYPVVPDSFMTRDGNAAGTSAQRFGWAEWPEEVDRPLVSPHDRWSF